MNADLSLFFGRFHPLLVHLPIGILLFAGLLEVLAWVNKSTQWQTAIKVALLSGACSAALAALAGYGLAATGSYAEQTLFWHQALGISTGVLALLVWGIKQRKSGQLPASGPWPALMLLLLVGLTGHLGGKLTHGSTYLTAYMPASMKRVLLMQEQKLPQQKVPASLDSVRVFKHVVQPLLESRCVGCHNPGKAQGGLVLTTAAALLKGGQSGPAVVPGDLKKSELIRRITLPHTSRKFMPANNLPPLSNVEVRILKWWVSEGAAFHDKPGATAADEKMAYLLAVYLGIDPEAGKALVLPQVPQASAGALSELKKAGILVRPLAEKSNLLEVSFVMARQASPRQRQEQLKKILKIKEQVYWLDVSNCGLKSQHMQVLGQLKNLARLSLQKNHITDNGVAYLKQLKKLEYLNVYQNPLGDKSLPLFRQLPALKKLNLWQTQVTASGVSALTGARQQLIVNY